MVQQKNIVDLENNDIIKHYGRIETNVYFILYSYNNRYSFKIRMTQKSKMKNYSMQIKIKQKM